MQCTRSWSIFFYDPKATCVVPHRVFPSLWWPEHPVRRSHGCLLDRCPYNQLAFSLEKEILLRFLGGIQTLNAFYQSLQRTTEALGDSQPWLLGNCSYWGGRTHTSALGLQRHHPIDSKTWPWPEWQDCKQQSEENISCGRCFPSRIGSTSWCFSSALLGDS